MQIILGMNATEYSVYRIKAFAREMGWAKSKFAIEAGLQPTTLRNFDSDGWNPTLDTLKALESIIPSNFTHEESSKKERGI